MTVLTKQLLNHPPELRLTLQDRSHVPILLFKTKMDGKIGSDRSELPKQFNGTFA
jgi:hypothetical protein